MPDKMSNKWISGDYIKSAPIWCSVDLRDGNQALVVPMSLQEKMVFFTFLVSLGFKEIEIGFPAASQTEYDFCRALIVNHLIPDDVTIQVLTQARTHIMDKTFEAVNGAKNVIIHLYDATSKIHREQVFGKTQAEIIDMTKKGVQYIKEYIGTSGTNYKLEYSPEYFTGTEMDFALEICNVVVNEWKPTPQNKLIINLPVTVELSLSSVYASQVEYICDNIQDRENVIISLHPHNDRGCAVADTELGLLAGGERVEGTLFGNGERTGNVDIVTLALNMFSQGVDPKLNLENIPEIIEMYERMTYMHVPERQPYAGSLVFAAFSGSHQDAIAKGFKCRKDNSNCYWNVPYLPIDPKDIGRTYDKDIIRVNSQSGKGGISYMLEHNFGIELPAKFAPLVSFVVKDESDRLHKEFSAKEIYDIFEHNFVNISEKVKIVKAEFTELDEIEAIVTIKHNNVVRTFKTSGNGRLDAVNNALQKCLNTKISVLYYSEHAMEVGAKSKAISYVEICGGNGVPYWGVGLNSDIVLSSINALVSAVNLAN